MAKKFVVAAALLALVALATATTYTTTVTTTMVDDEANPRQTQQCQRQVQGQRFQSCQRYLQQRSGSREEEEVLEMTTEVDNPRQQGQEQYLRQCCQQLRNVDEQCRCEAIRQAVRQSQQEQGSYQGGEMQQVYQKAQNLPQRCGFRSPQRCEIRAIFL